MRKLTRMKRKCIASIEHAFRISFVPPQTFSNAPAPKRTLPITKEIINTLRESSDALKETLGSQTARMKEIRKLPDYLATYHERKPVYDDLQKIKFTRAKEKYKTDHAAELKQFYEARRKLSAQFPDGKFDRQKLEAEYARLEQEHKETYAQFKSIRADSQQLWKIKSYVDSARKNLEQLQKHTSHKQEQEI